MFKSTILVCLFVFAIQLFASDQNASRTFSSIRQSISQIVGYVDKKPITSREVIWYDFVESHVHNKSIRNPLIIDNVDTKTNEFLSKTTNYALARAITLDAEHFEFPKPKNEDVAKLSQKIISSIDSLKIADFYKPTLDEINKLIVVKLVSEQFLKFKSQSSALPITDAEAKTYFVENKNKFSKSNFELVKSEIKLQMAKTQVDTRMNTWYNLLQEKYGYKDVVK